ncbi:MAG: peptidase MA family metallohydrolase [bacterium]
MRGGWGHPGVRIVLIALALTSAMGTLHAQNNREMPGQWQLLSRDVFHIWYEPQDAGYSRELADLIARKLPEFSEKLGVPVPDSITVVIAPNRGRFHTLTRGLPDWTGGAAYPADSRIILQSPTLYSNKAQFTVTALHELVHVLTDYREPSRLPRWLSEGLAMYLSGETMYNNRRPLGRAVVTGKTYTLEGIEDMLRFGPEQARVAYLQSISFVEFLVDRYGWPSMAGLLAGYRSGTSPDSLFEAISGRSLFDVEVAWHRSLRDQYRWYRLFEWINFDMLLWVGASMLVAVSGGLAILRRRRYLSEKDEESNPTDWPKPSSDDPPPDGEWYINKNEYWQ